MAQKLVRWEGGHGPEEAASRRRPRLASTVGPSLAHGAAGALRPRRRRGPRRRTRRRRVEAVDGIEAASRRDRGTLDEGCQHLDDEGVLWLWGTGPVVRYRAKAGHHGGGGGTGVATPISYAPLEHKYRVTTAAACWTFIAVAAVPFGCDQSPVQGVHTLPPAAYMSALRERRDDAAEQE